VQTVTNIHSHILYFPASGFSIIHSCCKNFVVLVSMPRTARAAQAAVKAILCKRRGIRQSRPLPRDAWQAQTALNQGNCDQGISFPAFRFTLIVPCCETRFPMISYSRTCTRVAQAPELVRQSRHVIGC